MTKGILSPAFISTVIGYTTEVTNDVTNLTVTPTASDPAATIKVNGVQVVSGTASGTIPLIVGSNLITTTVTAKDGTVKEYTTTVSRLPSSDADLLSLSLSSGTLVPTFSGSITSYTASVGNGITSITATAIVSNANAVIMINGHTVSSGSQSNQILLKVGANTVTVLVTAQDGTAKTYTIIVNRAASSNAELSALSTSSGTLTPSFEPDINTYNANVSGDINYINLTPVAADPAALILVNGKNVISGSMSQNISLQTGSNVIVTKVTATDGTTINYTVTVIREKRTQIITLGLLPQKATCSDDFEAGATSTNTANPILYASSDNTVATITSQGLIHILSAGHTTISANQSGDKDFTAADQVTEKLTVTDPIKPVVTFTLDHNTVCAGAPVTFTATVANVVTGLSYQWQVNGINVGNNSPNLTLVPGSSSDVFTCLVTNNSSCNATGTSNSYSGLIIEPVATAPVAIVSSSAFPVLPGTTITFTATPGNGTYQWQINGISVGSNSNSFSSNILKNHDVVTCIANNNTACSTPTISNEIIVSVLSDFSQGINNTFTPNNDGINDTWTIKGLDAYPHFTLKIFDRNGSIVHQAKGTYTPWDGTLSARPLPVGTYYYVIDLGTQDKVFGGYITIIR